MTEEPMDPINLTVGLADPPLNPTTLRHLADNMRDIFVALTYAVDSPPLNITLTGEAAHIREHGCITVAYAGKILGKHRSTIYRWIEDDTLPSPHDGLVDLYAVIALAEKWRGQ